MGVLIAFPQPPLRFWWVHPERPGSRLWVADFLGTIEGASPGISPTSRYYAIENARTHPVHFGLPVIVQAEARSTGGRAA